LQAAIAAVHSGAPTWDDTDWDEVVRLYDQLGEIWPSPVVGLNRAVAVSLASGPAAGLLALDAIAGQPELAGYGYLPAARADMLARLERYDEAAAAYESALALTTNEVEREFLSNKLREVSQSSRC
jgi:RNA polymerase sigma-70 factor (ECF subfamily)